MRQIVVALALALTALAGLLSVETLAAPAPTRAYELVSPADAGGVDVEAAALADSGVSFSGSVPRFSPISGDGERVLLLASPPIPGLDASGVGTDVYLAERAPAGWTMRYVGWPGARPTRFVSLLGGLPDLSTVYIQSGGVAPDAGHADTLGGLNRALHVFGSDSAAGAFTWISRGDLAPGPATGPLDRLRFGGASSEGRHVVFDSTFRILRESPPPSFAFHLYERVDGATTRLVSLRPDGGHFGSMGSAFQAISPDGARILFTAGPPGGERLWLRQGGDETIEVSASRRTPSDAPQAVRFEGASEDLATIFLSTGERLTPDDDDESRDVYRYELGADTLVRVSGGPGEGAETCHAFSPFGSSGEYGGCDVAVLGVSRDGSTVVLAAPERLDATNGTHDQPNVYVWRGGQRAYVATMAERAIFDPFFALTSDDFASGGVPRLASASARQARLTPDGRRFVFASGATLTAYDNTDPTTGTKRVQVHMYDAETEEIECLSCRSDGQPPLGDSRLVTSRDLRFPYARNVTDDGARVFFEAPDRLVPEDVNGALDVYEWHDGDVRLISSGRDPEGSTLAGSTPDGSSVFFHTTEALVPQDRNADGVRVYAARIGGGFDVPSSPAGCAGDGCRPEVSAPPDPVTPGSERLFGRGNPRPASRRRLAVTIRSGGPTARRRSARTGRLFLRVRATRRVRLEVRVRARLAPGGRPRTIARARRTVRKQVTMRLRLSRGGRRALRRRGVLRMRVVATTPIGVSAATVVTLRGGRP